MGDAYLIEVAQRFRACLRERDTLGRIGGDEFIAVLTDLGGAEIALNIAERLVHAMDEPFVIEGHTIRGAVSVGLAFYPSSSNSAIGIIQWADQAMYTAKRAAGNRVSYSEPALVPGGTRASQVCAASGTHRGCEDASVRASDTGRLVHRCRLVMRNLERSLKNVETSLCSRFGAECQRTRRAVGK